MTLETLIEFIFSNLFFVFIIIGGIISFLKRLKETNNQPSKPAQRPSVSGKKQEASIPREQNPDFSSVETIQVENKRPQTNLQHAEEKLYQFKEQVEERSSTKLKRHSLNKTVINKKTFKNPSKNKLREGIIWAEILHSPRAHKPYGRDAFRRTKG
ncbi:hypothetical protein [Bacillus taeanensis]|uniref:Uncharacterized protein n=1 Tax=Bacillus taeanensis TaxID=273032 RepID=A0A366XZE7_9BACI|nr:hypothetical protein [Bacillus taeanensis]RBW70505.1 hypothetical protein DS031_05630 [Bacillus taeanensis]